MTGAPLKRLAGLLALAAVPTAVLAVFFLLPVWGMLQRGLWSEGSFDPGALLDVLAQERTRDVIWFTLWTSTVSTVVAVVMGLPAAYVLHRLAIPMRSAVRAALLVPFVLPTVVVGIAVRELVSESGPLGFLHLDGTPVAILIGLVFFNVAVVIRTVGTAWESLDRRPAEAAAALGASPLHVLTTVTLPALRPAIVSAAAVVFLFCATGFGVVLMLGGTRYASVETEIYLLTTGAITGTVEYQAAAALSLVQLAAVVVLLAVAARLRAVPDPTVRRAKAAPARPQRHDLPAVVATGLVLLAIATPVVTLVVGSLRRDGAWTLVHYRALRGSGEDVGASGMEGGLLRVPVTEALANSLRIAVDATWMSLLLGLLVAFVVTRKTRSRTEASVRNAFDGLFMLPLGVSAVTLGFGFLITLDDPPLDLRSSALLVPIAQALVALPLVVRVLVPVLQGIDDRQRQAAASLGAGPLRALLTVDVPVLWRPLLAAAGFAFAVSLGEFGATSFIVRAQVPTLPVVIYRLIGSPGELNYGTAMAASVVLAAATALVILLVERLRVPGVGVI
ncbi:ABC transporter permease subunit [Nocardioides sp. HM23]|uniref:ABC transporter permease n=1 Tax=Nocardioides bizhenqiangii TaxID=3095076 RepID=UPI002ACAAC79|nr:ABC transporter permease subunit [Nocardioides sp. HM23]MDZ5622634.1 ABC transporter permease subunit [Nocardioides sp. HM23]